MPIDANRHLPLTPLALHILLALAESPLHGYGIIRDIEERSDGAMRIRSGTLYTAIQRLANQGLLEESDERPTPDKDDQRRRYYEITALGRDVMRLEAGRLTAILETAMERRVIGSTAAASAAAAAGGDAG